MKRKIAAILAADIAGYSKLVADDEEETLRRLASYRSVIDDFIAKAGGRIFNTAGDAVLAEFPSAVEAVRCAIDVQESLRTRNLAYPASRQMSFRIGITIGDVVERDGDLLGDGVNIAARLEGLAPVGGICISRSVHEQVANKLSVRFDDVGEQQVKNIPTPVHAFMLQMRTEDNNLKTVVMPAKSASAAPSSRWKWPAAVVLAGAGALAAAAFYLPSQFPLASYLPAGWTTPYEAPAPQPSAKKQASRPPQRQAEALVPETVPFIRDRDRAQIRSIYMSAPDHKALAVSGVGLGLITGQPDEEAARRAALDSCQRVAEAVAARANAGAPSRCEVFAVGNIVVFARAHPPLPPQPWFTRNAAIETPFAAAQIPLVSENDRRLLDRLFGRGPKAKAIALSPTGSFIVHNGHASVQEAVRRSLERCGYNAGVACMTIAVDDVFVVPVPTSMKVVGFAQAGVVNAVASDMRDEVARRLGNAPSGWNAVAVGAGGRPGVALGAATEQAASSAAMTECARQDSSCRIVVLGPFLVEGALAAPAASSPPAPPPSPPTVPVPSANRPTTLAGTLTAMLTLTPAARDELVKIFEGVKPHKALVGVPGTNTHWRVTDRPSAELAEERGLEGCQVFINKPCAPIAVNDRVTPEPADGKWPVRDMPRVHYAGLFDPERIPSALPSMSNRADILGYRNAAGPKATAFHAWGRIFIVTAATSQRSAEEQALATCNADPTRSGQNGPCFIYAVGDQVVLPQRRTAPMTAAAAPAVPPPAPAATPSTSAGSKYAAVLSNLTAAVPGLNASTRDDTIGKYGAAEDHKAMAFVPGTTKLWRSARRGNLVTAEESVLEGCQIFHNQPCALIALDDTAQRTTVDGKWPTRDMARVHYAGAFNPERIAATGPAARRRPDVAGYATAPGPKAVAFHPVGRVFVVSGAASQRAAEMRALQECSLDVRQSGFDPPCYLYAIGDQVILPQRRTEPVAAQ